jgi:hypothetical protein
MFVVYNIIYKISYLKLREMIVLESDYFDRRG